jgi:hypothetical protein
MATGRIPINGTAAIQSTIVDAKGDLIVATGADAVSRLAVGTNGYTLVADSAETTGLKWAAPAAAAFVGCSVYASANQSINNATNTILNFNSEEFDTDGFHDTSSNTSRITIPSGKGGKYLVIGNVAWDSNGTGTRNIDFLLNGIIDIYPGSLEANNAAGFTTQIVFSLIRNYSAGDYIQLRVYQSSGGALNVLNGTNYTRFQVQYLGA